TGPPSVKIRNLVTFPLKRSRRESLQLVNRQQSLKSFEGFHCVGTGLLVTRGGIMEDFAPQIKGCPQPVIVSIDHFHSGNITRFLEVHLSDQSISEMPFPDLLMEIFRLGLQSHRLKFDLRHTGLRQDISVPIRINTHIQY